MNLQESTETNSNELESIELSKAPQKRPLSERFLSVLPLFGAVLSVLFWVTALILGYVKGYSFTIDPLNPVVLGNFSLVVLSLETFVFSILFFGVLTPLLFVYHGFLAHDLIVSDLANNLGVKAAVINIIYILPLLLAAYSGTILGISALKDFTGKGNILERRWQVLGYLIVSVTLSLILPFIK